MPPPHKYNVAHLHVKSNGVRAFKTPDGKNVSNRVVDGVPMRSLPIPPNLTDVVVFMDKNSPILFTGKSAIGKTQYTYRTWHVEKSDYKKFCLLLEFERKLPAILQRIETVLQQGPLTKEKVVALILRIVYLCNFRVGTKSKQTSTEAKGITTLERKDFKMSATGVEIAFEGKSRAHNQCAVRDPLVLAAIRQLDRLTSTNRGNRPSAKGATKSATKREFFFSIPEHMNEPRTAPKKGGGKSDWYRISHLDVNDFLKQFNPAFTTKVFRTWNANILFEREAVAHIKSAGISETESGRKKELKEIIGRVAARLHHTVAISRKKYIIPQFTELYQSEPKRFGEFAASKKPFISFLKNYCSKCNDGNCRN